MIINMFSVIKTGGKQYIVFPGDKIKIEKLEKKEGDEIIFSEVLLSGDDKEKVKIGNPLIKDGEVKAKVVRHGKGKKLIIFKYKPKKRYKRKIGHRQPFTEVEILSVD